MRRTSCFIIGCILAALMPFAGFSSHVAGDTAGINFPGWPRTFSGRTLTAQPLSERELRFKNDFPGRIARFTDGNRELIIRWVAAPTRRLHPASDCLESTGFRVRPLGLYTDQDGNRWASFSATRGDEKLRVYERIYSETGECWTDVSAWYWAATFKKSAGPWWAITIAERDVD